MSDDVVPLGGVVSGQAVPMEGAVPSPVELQVQPTFTAEQIKEDGRNRVAKTAGQALGAGSGGVIALRYLFVRYLPAHLPPDDVLLVLVGVFATGFARVQNRHRYRGEA